MRAEFIRRNAGSSSEIEIVNNLANRRLIGSDGEGYLIFGDMRSPITMTFIWINDNGTLLIDLTGKSDLSDLTSLMVRAMRIPSESDEPDFSAPGNITKFGVSYHNDLGADVFINPLTSVLPCAKSKWNNVKEGDWTSNMRPIFNNVIDHLRPPFVFELHLDGMHLTLLHDLIAIDAIEPGFVKLFIDMVGERYPE